MKAYLLLIASYLISNAAGAQASLAPDQNPDFAISRDKYIKIADSVNAWHSTTIQDTYKAIDWIADKQEARAERREFRRDLRRYRAANSYGYYGYYNYNYGNRGYYRNNYRRGYNYYPNYYRGYRRNNFWGNLWFSF
jgi:hypothetical protein